MSINMKFKTKEHTVDAMHVSQVVSIANNNFKSLPVWIKKKYQQSKIFIGAAGVIVNDAYHCEISDSDSVLVLNQNKQLILMSEKEFDERYQDCFDSSSSGIHVAGVDNIPTEGTWLLFGGERVVASRTNFDFKNYLATCGR